VLDGSSDRRCEGVVSHLQLQSAATGPRPNASSPSIVNGVVANHIPPDIECRSSALIPVVDG